VVLVCAINPYVLIPLVPLAFGSAYYRNHYLATSREVKRLESASRSPVHSDFAASLDGLATIRAYQSEPYFIREFMKHQDDNGRGFFAFLVTSRWIGVRLDAISVLFIIAVTFFSVIIRDSISPVMLTLYITHCLCLTAVSHENELCGLTTIGIGGVVIIICIKLDGLFPMGCTNNY
jgi:ABC-type multidrug transport system fused ATPase/permease subunit